MNSAFDTLQHLEEALKVNPQVLALVQIGPGRPHELDSRVECDLFVIVARRPASVESLHFSVGGRPVSLFVRTEADLQRAWPLTDMDFSLPDGELRFDRDGTFGEALSALRAKWSQPQPALGVYEEAFERFSKTHVLIRAGTYLDTDPLLCNYLLNTHLHWLFQSYFAIRGMVYPGENGALQYWAANEPHFYRDLEQFYEDSDLPTKLELMEGLTAAVLEPIGGLWPRDRLFVYGLDGDISLLEEQGRQAWNVLFSQQPGDRTQYVR